MASNGKVIHLVDNDFLIKLARWDLLAEFLSAFGIAITDVRAIISLRRRLYLPSGKPNLKFVGTAPAAARLHSFLTTIKPPIPTDPDFTILATGVLHFDDGEVVLVSALCAGAGEYFYTGDKKAIRAMVNFKDTCFDAKIRGRVMCLEQALPILMDKHGYSYIREKISSDRDADEKIAHIFWGAAQTPESDARGGLKTVVDELQAECGGLLRK